MKLYLLLGYMVFSNFLFSQRLKTNDVEGAWHLKFIEHHVPDISSAYPVRDSGEDMESGTSYDRVEDYYMSTEYWVFKGNKVSRVDYPCCLLGSGKLSSNDTSTGIYFPDIRLFYTLTLKNDTLLASNFLHTYYLIRANRDSEKLHSLTRGKINPDCLMGTWEIPVGEVSVAYDAIMISYPWKMVDTLTINERNINWYWSKNRFYLDVDGVKRPFKVKTVSNSGSDDNLILVPERWKKYYRDKQNDYNVETVWLRKVYFDADQ